MKLSPFLPAACLGAALFGLTARASAAALVQTGVLACNVEPGVGLIIGSSKTVTCIFHPAHGRPEHYTGTISRIGLDIGGTGPGQYAWGVVTAGPTRPLALAGNYTGPLVSVSPSAMASMPMRSLAAPAIQLACSPSRRAPRPALIWRQAYRRPEPSAGRGGGPAAPWLNQSLSFPRVRDLGKMTR